MVYGNHLQRHQTRVAGGFHITPHLVLKEPQFEKAEGKHWRNQLRDFIHSKRVHTIMLVLLVLDVMLVITGIALEIQNLSGALHLCESTVESCVAKESCTMRDFENHALVTAEHWTAYLSLAILAIFIIENLLLIVALGPIGYFSNLLYALDFVVVITSFVLETLFIDKPEEGLLVLYRVWRFVRIAHTFYETNVDEELERVKHAIKQAERELLAMSLTPEAQKEAHEALAKRMAESYPDAAGAILSAALHYAEHNKHGKTPQSDPMEVKSSTEGEEEATVQQRTP